MRFAVVVPWHNKNQLNEFREAWNVTKVIPEWLFLTQGDDGCANTKNRGIKNALDAGAEYIVVLDDDCYPPPGVLGQPQPSYSLTAHAEAHIYALQPKPVRLFFPATSPPSRGTVYFNHSIDMPVAASMGFWLKNPDLDAAGSLVRGENPDMYFSQTTVYNRYFPFSGMNFAFHRSWADCAVLIDVPRFDDIWMGLIWQKVAYNRGRCFNLNGPLVNHVRQSNVWANLRDEAQYLETNETLWVAVHSAPAGLTAEDLRHKMFDAPKVAQESLGVIGAPSFV